MARLPIPGQDAGAWGEVLNDYLQVAHTTTGTIKDDAVGSDQLQAGSITSSHLAPGAVTGSSIATGTVAESQLTTALQDKINDSAAAPDATTSSKGIVQLAGDLAGTAASPTVPGLATKAATSA